MRQEKYDYCIPLEIRGTFDVALVLCDCALLLVVVVPGESLLHIYQVESQF